MLKRYGGLSHILSLELDEGWEFFMYAAEKDAEEMLFEIYLRTEMKIPFEHFKEENLKRVGNINDKPQTREEVLSKVEAILDGFGKEGN